VACEGVEVLEVGAGVDEEVGVFGAEKTRTKERRDEKERERGGKKGRNGQRWVDWKESCEKRDVSVDSPRNNVILVDRDVENSLPVASEDVLLRQRLLLDSRT